MKARSSPGSLTDLRLAVIFLSLVGILTFAVSREVTSTSRPVSTQLSPRPLRAALSAAEEAYMGLLWPIHGDVERSAMRMSLGQILYKTGDLSRSELKTRMEQALATYRVAETRILALEPPTSLRSEHEQYLTAVRDQDVQGWSRGAPARRLSEEPGGKRQDHAGRGQVLAERVPAQLRRGGAWSSLEDVNAVSQQ